MNGVDAALPFKYARGNLCMPIICITAAYEGKRNIMTSAWCAPASFIPPTITTAIGMTRYTHDLIMNSREFVMNIMASDQEEIAVFCGNHSGRDMDKFRELNLTVNEGRIVRAPLLVGCAAQIECKVLSCHRVGDHTLFVGETVAYNEDTNKMPLIRFRGDFYTLSDYSLGKDEHPSKV
jgi:flavin reductase (DIM6/NTAB) family NADH-FMN oxidoreductase RutF